MSVPRRAHGSDPPKRLKTWNTAAIGPPWPKWLRMDGFGGDNHTAPDPHHGLCGRPRLARVLDSGLIGSLAVICLACWCSRTGPLAKLASAP